jgi:hypothetical protein
MLPLDFISIIVFSGWFAAHGGDRRRQDRHVGHLRNRSPFIVGTIAVDDNDEDGNDNDGCESLGSKEVGMEYK